MKKFAFILLIAILMAGGVGAARAAKGNTSVDSASVAGGRAFSLVLSESGNADHDVAAFAEALRKQGFSEKEIQENVQHYRTAWEESRRNVSRVETITFSVVVNSNDIRTYKQKLEQAGLTDEEATALAAELQEEVKLQSPQTAKDPCRIRTDGAEARNALGQVLYRYSSSIHWCYNGSQITWLHTWESYSTYWGWQFKGSRHNSSGSVGAWRFTLDRYATMYNSITGNYGYPDTHQMVYGNGYSWGTASP